MTTTDTTADTIFGLRVFIAPELPVVPTPGDEARYIVRKGLEDVLEWLGEEVGPEPRTIHALVMDLQRAEVPPVMMVSPGVYHGLVTGPKLAGNDAYNVVWEARDLWLRQK